MELFTVIILMLIGIFFFLLEIFLFPGISIAGIFGVLFVASSVFYAFTSLSPIVAFVILMFGIILLGISIWLFIRSRTLDKVSLHSEIKGTVNPLKGLSIQKGDRGKTISRLAPMGTVEINNSRVEAKSLGEFIDQKTEVEVIEISENKIIVRAI